MGVTVALFVLCGFELPVVVAMAATALQGPGRESRDGAGADRVGQGVAVAVG